MAAAAKIWRQIEYMGEKASICSISVFTSHINIYTLYHSSAAAEHAVGINLDLHLKL